MYLKITKFFSNKKSSQNNEKLQNKLPNNVQLTEKQSIYYIALPTVPKTKIDYKYSSGQAENNALFSG